MCDLNPNDFQEISSYPDDGDLVQGARIEIREGLTNSNDEEGLLAGIQISAKLIFTTLFLLFVVSPDVGPFPAY